MGGEGKTAKNNNKDSVLAQGIMSSDMGGALVVHTHPAQPKEEENPENPEEDKDKSSQAVFSKDPSPCACGSIA